ncbi:MULTISPECIES: putative leader peptide [unclassified Streptomyces]|uniref:putative leader peptide n=1 Tax=unclassified Streptomyces TaxID=2593676 RepID=UPI00362A633E
MVRSLRPRPGGAGTRGEAYVPTATTAPHAPVRAGARLVCRRHVDLCRTASAICPSLRA